MTKQKEKKKASIVKKMMIAVVAGFGAVEARCYY